MLEKYVPLCAVLVPTRLFQLVDKSLSFMLTPVEPTEVNGLRNVDATARLALAQTTKALQSCSFGFRDSVLFGRDNRFLRGRLDCFLFLDGILDGGWRRDSRWWCLEVVLRRSRPFLSSLSKLLHLLLHLSVCLPYQIYQFELGKIYSKKKT